MFSCLMNSDTGEYSVWGLMAIAGLLWVLWKSYPGRDRQCQAESRGLTRKLIQRLVSQSDKDHRPKPGRSYDFQSLALAAAVQCHSRLLTHLLLNHNRHLDLGRLLKAAFGKHSSFRVKQILLQERLFTPTELKSMLWTSPSLESYDQAARTLVNYILLEIYYGRSDWTVKGLVQYCQERQLQEPLLYLKQLGLAQ